jgi:hypothetical protein
MARAAQQQDWLIFFIGPLPAFTPLPAYYPNIVAVRPGAGCGGEAAIIWVTGTIDPR